LEGLSARHAMADSRMMERNGDQDRVLRDAFGAHLPIGERGAQTDEAEVDFAIVERLELFSDG
jgi:hypothetical protein